MPIKKTTHYKTADFIDKEAFHSRSAGILMHITSLPSAFGIGDLGPEAKVFADFLHRSGQKYWQILPLNATDVSPYSAHSGFAGNTTLISPELLVKAGFLYKNDIEQYRLPCKSEVDFKEAEKIRAVLLKMAYTKFCEIKSPSMEKQFAEFRKQETYWLHDFAMYTLLKKIYKGAAWALWPDKFKLRDVNTLDEFSKKHKEDLEEIKWQQYIFNNQWKELKAYCNNKDIQMFGDLPIYVSYDSVDVWANAEVFNLDKKGNMVGVAGVPPDYFSETGQLWGMPVFRWEVLKKENYSWWVQRVGKNIALYDLIRLDHFRAFADFWEVPAKSVTAINGKWKPGPGLDFFKVIHEKFGSLPFVAEDLGEMDKIVFDLRDALDLPGMKVLQFAFGEDMPHSTHIPHNHRENFVAYTGTHDNNTTVGWFRQDAGKIEKKHLSKYSGKKVTDKNVHLVLGSLAYASVAKLCIVPMQDVLGLDEKSRFNTPGSIVGNWQWRLTPEKLTQKVANQLKQWVHVYKR
jgi:4-alpha-glucanotransferase